MRVADIEDKFGDFEQLILIRGQQISKIIE
jgi:hypothetical protein